MLTILVHARQRLNGPPGSFAHAGRGGVTGVLVQGFGVEVLVRGGWGEGIGAGLRLERRAGGIRTASPLRTENPAPSPA